MRAQAVKALAAALLLVAITTGAAGAQQDPHMTEFHGHGYIDCSVTVTNTLSGNTCQNVRRNIRGPVVGTPLWDSSQDTAFDVPIDARMTTLVVRFEADARPTLATDDLVFRLWWDNPPAAIPATVGPSGTQATYTFSDDQAWNQSPREGHFNVELMNSDVQAAVDLRVDVWLGLFYDGEPVPDGYVPGPERI